MASPPGEAYNSHSIHSERETMKRFSWLFTLCMGILPVFAGAAPVEVARVKLVLAEPNWESTTVDLGDAKLDSARSNSNTGMCGALEGHAKVLVLRDADRKAVATMLVYATYGAARNLRMTGGCPADPRLYVRDFTNGRQESPECVLIDRVDANAFVKDGRSRLGQAYAKAPFDVPAKALLLWGYFANSTGAIIQVETLIDPALKGLDGVKPGAAVPTWLSEPVAAWADAFGESARKALRSFSGELKVPPMEFF